MRVVTLVSHRQDRMCDEGLDDGLAKTHHEAVKGLICRDLSKGKWCPGPESNQRHADFQSAALPTELPGPAKRVAASPRRIEVPVL